MGEWDGWDGGWAGMPFLQNSDQQAASRSKVLLGAQELPDAGMGKAQSPARAAAPIVEVIAPPAPARLGRRARDARAALQPSVVFLSGE